MKKVLLGTFLFAMTAVFPVPTMAEVSVSINIGLPPPIVFAAPPELIVLPDTDYVYVAPAIDVDLFFWNGWWWRFWEGRWYRSHYYNRGWGYYNYVPRFYYDVDPGWRRYYRERSWYGHRWNYAPIPERRLQQNWKTWQNNRYWDKKRTWNVQNYQPRPQQQRMELRNQRQKQYQQMPEVQRHQQQMRERQMQQRQMKPQVQQPPPQQPRPQAQPRQMQQPRVEQRQMQQQPRSQFQQQQPRPQGQQHQMQQQHGQPKGQERRMEPQHQGGQGRPEGKGGGRDR